MGRVKQKKSLENRFGAAPAVEKPTLPKGLEDVNWRAQLRNSIIWKQLKSEFSSDELQYFENRFVALMEEFKQDVNRAEENQLFQAIKFELLMHRHLREKKNGEILLKQYKNRRKKILLPVHGDFTLLSDTEKATIQNLEEKIGLLIEGIKNNNEFVRLQQEYNKIMESLKATRNQRIERIESGNVSFTGLVKELQDKDFNEKEGRTLALFQKATEKELQKLGSPHTYIDGSIDLPILTAETLEEFDKHAAED